MPKASCSLLTVVAILAVAVVAVPFADFAYAARGGGHGGGGHGGGGGFHGGGGFRGGGGFHAGGFHGGGFHGGGFHGGGMHAFRGAPSRGAARVGRSYSARHFQSHSAGTQNVHVSHGNISHGVAAGHATPNRMTQRSATAVGHSLSSPRIRNALHAPGGLRNPAARAAITVAAAGAVWSHHQGGLWWRHPHGGFGWVGPVFWPYAYNDLYDYAWWGGGYDPYFWDYGYADLYAGLFDPYDYNSLSGYADYLPGYTGHKPVASNGSDTTALADMCGNASRDIAGFPIEQFRAAIQPNSEQSAALDELANASQKAAETIQNSCPKDVALTAPSRLADMQQRLEAMRSAVETLKPALDKFYGLLSDDQKAKVTALVADQQRAKQEQPASTSSSSGTCNAEQSTATVWPGDLIERNVKPTDAQQAGLKVLQNATANAADILKSSCAPQDALTPPARLAAAEAKLDAMLQAIQAVRPALDNFYGSLTDEQKAAFDAIGPARNGTHTASAADGGETLHRHHYRHHYGYNVRGMISRIMGL